MKAAMRGRAEACRLHEVLQQGVLACGYAVELVQVEQAHLRQLPLHGLGACEVHAVRVVGPQLGRQDGAAEGGLPHALFVADEQGRDALGVHPV